MRRTYSRTAEAISVQYKNKLKFFKCTSVLFQILQEIKQTTHTHTLSMKNDIFFS